MARTLESERILDAAIECTFPASDPVAVHEAFQAACERERDAKRAGSDGPSGARARPAPTQNAS